jgi:tungstate transport system ATP-binding protein
VAESLLKLNHVVVRYGDKIVLQVPRLMVNSGEVLALLGPNGAGKTTLLRVIGLLQAPSDGSVQFDGIPASSTNSLAIRRRIATVFQEPLLLNATVYQNAALGLKLRGLRRAEIQDRVAPWLERLGIAHLAGRSARTLSGGEAQRTSLVRALAINPDLLLLDEPFGALDPASREALLSDFRRIVKQRRVTTVFVTHDRAEAFALADRVGVLARGGMLQLGARDEVFLRPASRAVAEIVGVENRLAGVVHQDDGCFSVITIGKTSVSVPAKFPLGTKVILCIRAEDLALAPAYYRASDALSFHGKVADVLPGISHCRVAVDCSGVTLTATVDQGTGMIFARGDEVTASIKPVAVHVIQEEPEIVA